MQAPWSSRAWSAAVRLTDWSTCRLLSMTQRCITIPCAALDLGRAEGSKRGRRAGWCLTWWAGGSAVLGSMLWVAASRAMVVRSASRCATSSTGQAAGSSGTSCAHTCNEETEKG